MIKIVNERNIPGGRESLSVFQDAVKDGYIPLYVIGSEDIVTKQLLYEERKKAILPSDQYPTIGRLLKVDPNKLRHSNSDNGRHALRHNLLMAMGEEASSINNAFGGADVHHIIQLNDKEAEKSRIILASLGVDINAPENGILLPDGSIDSIYHGSKHLKGKSHSTNYTQYVYDHIKSVKSKRELLEILDFIKKELWNEELSLYDQ